MISTTALLSVDSVIDKISFGDARRINMQVLELKQKFEEIIKELPKSKLEAVIDFASYLRSREASEELSGMQMNSKAYQEWVSSENDIYDEVFKDEIK